jgi:hypothetical protein
MRPTRDWREHCWNRCQGLLGKPSTDRRRAP